VTESAVNTLHMGSGIVHLSKDQTLAANNFYFKKKSHLLGGGGPRL